MLAAFARDHGAQHVADEHDPGDPGGQRPAAGLGAGNLPRVNASEFLTRSGEISLVAWR